MAIRYSQNSEQEIIENYFKGFIGIFADLGCNDGITLSNTYSLVQRGWRGLMVEASSKAFSRLLDNMGEYSLQLWLHEGAIGSYNGMVDFYESGGLLNQGDVALVSSVNESELKRWEPIKMPFEKTSVPINTWEYIYNMSRFKKFDFISIDIEGNDLEVLKQIDLNDVGCQCLCIEHNSVLSVVQEIREYCAFFGLNNEIGYNAENIILAR